MCKVKSIFLYSLLLIHTFNIHAKTKEIAKDNPIVLQALDHKILKQFKKEITNLYNTFYDNYQLFKIKNQEYLQFNRSISYKTMIKNWNAKNDAQGIAFNNLQDLLILLEKSLPIIQKSLNIIAQLCHITDETRSLEYFAKNIRDLPERKKDLKQQIITKRELINAIYSQVRADEFEHLKKGIEVKNLKNLPEFTLRRDKLIAARKDLEEIIDMSTQTLLIMLFSSTSMVAGNMFDTDKKTGIRYREDAVLPPEAIAINKEAHDLKELIQEIRDISPLLEIEEVSQFVKDVQIQEKDILIDF